MPKNKQEIVSLIENNKTHLQKFGVKRLGLFGSVASDSQTNKSDVDILVEFDKGQKNFKNFMGLANFTEKLFGTNVDLITLESLSPHIGPHIKKETYYVQIT